MASLPERQRVSRQNNTLREPDKAVHDWYRFVLSFPPHLVREYVDRFGLGPGRTVLDPFCGTGTTLVECKRLGIASIGVEASPMAWFASSVKVDWAVDPRGLVDHARGVAETAAKLLDEQGVPDIWAPLFSRPIGAVHPVLRSLPDEAASLLLTDSISPRPLHKVLVLQDILHARRDDRFWRHEQLALAKALVCRIGNLEFGPEIGVGPAKPDVPVVATWLEQVRQMAEDLGRLSSAHSARAEVIHGDSRDLRQLLPPATVDAVITSPPYPNEKDYTRTTRLESVLLGFVLTKSDLRQQKKNLVRSNTRGVYKTDDDDAVVSRNEMIKRIAEDIEARRVALGKTSGFERLYPRVTKLYFGGMFRHLESLRFVLRPGARLAYVVGDQASYLRIMIRTGQILGELATELGYRLEGIDLFRTRRATATRQDLREEVVILRWPGWESQARSHE